MKFKEMLRRVVGGRRHRERLQMFRQFWLAKLATSGCNPRSKSWIERKTSKDFEALIVHGVERGLFTEVILDFPIWRKKHHQRQRQAAAKARWKTFREKSLGGTSSSGN
jgi:hypothetical protein